MDQKPVSIIPIDSFQSQRLEVYINELQAQLQMLRNKYDAIFVECCEIQKKLQQVSSESMTKQQEISKIINEFEELRQSTATADSVLKEALVQKVGDVKRLREKFEAIFKENIEDLIVRSKKSIANLDKINLQRNGDPALKSYASCPNPMTSVDEQHSVYWSTFDSFYSISNGPSEEPPESICLEGDEVAEALD